MSYQVLARKWRPRSFDDMVGQQHVVQALRNALERGQLHHAYLFTGTRGVGKTTLARILSKALNCEQGLSATPCGACSTCREIDSGRFVDLLEVDAASRTKVDQTRELLDNVPYAPARGRFKVYLIDEVHMFSGHSFNALLKTLEEPPPHVKFLLATTDSQKLPVTVLSRCLQFNLRRLLPDEISARLQHVLETEDIVFEPTALPLLARAADGSMRDGLSLLDQAIAFGGGQVAIEAVRAMLGTADGELTLDLLDALAAGQGAELLALVERAASLTPDFSLLLRELLGLLHRLALIQQVPQTLAADDPDQARLSDLAARLSPEDLQLYYQVALNGQGDLALAPDPRTGFEMVLLRALAFRPAQYSYSVEQPADTRAARARVAEPQPQGGADQVAAAPPPTQIESNADWHRLVDSLGLRGISAELANNCDLLAWDNGRLTLRLDPQAEHLRVASAESRLRAALEQALGQSLKIEIEIATPQQETLAQRRAREAMERQREAQELMRADPVASQIREQFDADWTPNSIEPLD